MNDELKPIPQFDNEDEERNFWATHDSSEYIDWSQAERSFTFPNLKRSTHNGSTNGDHVCESEVVAIMKVQHLYRALWMGKGVE